MYKLYNTIISEIFTESDKVMAILLLENNHDNFKNCSDMQQVLAQKEADPKHTKVDSNNDFFVVGIQKILED